MAKNKYFDYPIEKIKTNPDQVRKVFDPIEIEHLAESIKKVGIINPIEIDENDVIVTGERRYRAGLIAKLKTIPVKRITVNEKHLDLHQVHENEIRSNLNPFEVAQALLKIKLKHKFTDLELIKYVGSSRSSVQRSWTILKLDAEDQKYFKEGKLNMGDVGIFHPVNTPEVKGLLIEARLVKKLGSAIIDNIGSYFRTTKDIATVREVIENKNKMTVADIERYLHSKRQPATAAVHEMIHPGQRLIRAAEELVDALEYARNKKITPLQYPRIAKAFGDITRAITNNQKYLK